MKRVTFIPRVVAEGIFPPENSYLISLTHPGEKASVSQWPNKDRFEFDDIEVPVSGSSMFTSDQAKSLIWLVRMVRADNVYVHCEAGMSRSAAVARWLSDRLDYDLWLHPDGIGTSEHYNRHVYRTLDAADGRDLASYYTELEMSEREMQ